MVLNNFKYLVLVCNNGCQLFWKNSNNLPEKLQFFASFFIKLGIPLRFFKITLSRGSLILIFKKYRWFSDSEIFWKPDLTRQLLTKSTTHTTLIIPVWFSKFPRKTQQIRVRCGSVQDYSYWDPWFSDRFSQWEYTDVTFGDNWISESDRQFLPKWELGNGELITFFSIYFLELATCF